jgi:hypothetical protein
MDRYDSARLKGVRSFYEKTVKDMEELPKSDNTSVQSAFENNIKELKDLYGPAELEFFDTDKVGDKTFDQDLEELMGLVHEYRNILGSHRKLLFDEGKVDKDFKPLNEMSLANILREVLKEVSYSSFKNETKHRTKSEQLHKAVREIKKRSLEMDKLVEYTMRLKTELSEADSGMKYWKATNNALGKISETISQVNNKIKNLIQ